MTIYNGYTWTQAEIDAHWEDKKRRDDELITTVYHERLTDDEREWLEELRERWIDTESLRHGG